MAQQASVTEVVSQAVANSALELDAKAIITATESGYTARMVSKYRPKAPIIAVTPNEHVMRRMCLLWGVTPLLGVDARNTDEMFQVALERAMRAGYINFGDLVIITAGVPVGRSGTTNLIKIHHVGDMVARGQGIGTQSATGKVVTARTPEEANAKATEGCILVAVSTDKDYMPAIRKAAGVITETGGITSHAAVVGLNLGIPVIVGVENALKLLTDGTEVAMYAEIGIITAGKESIL
jgi:pyruvate kinase